MSENREKLDQRRHLESLETQIPMSSVPESADGNAELGADTMGNVSEVLGEIKEVSSGVGVGDDDSGDNEVNVQRREPLDISEIRERLLNQMPSSEKLVKRQIEAEIRKEIKYLHKKAMKMMKSPGSVNYFEMANVLMKMRELRSVLSGLFKASVDSLKTLWLRFVHGIM